MLPSQNYRNNHWKPRTPWYQTEEAEATAWMVAFVASVVFTIWVVVQL